jgi:hypothetical protein
MNKNNYTQKQNKKSAVVWSAVSEDWSDREVLLK